MDELQIDADLLIAEERRLLDVHANLMAAASNYRNARAELDEAASKLESVVSSRKIGMDSAFSRSAFSALASAD